MLRLKRRKNRHLKEHCHSHFRIHDKLQSPTELLKLHLKHYHMSTEQYKRRTSALKLPKEIVTSMIRSPNHVTHVPSPRLHPQEPRYLKFEVTSLVNLLSLITEKLQLILGQNFNSYLFMIAQLLWQLHMLSKIDQIPWRSLIFKSTSKRISWIQNTLLQIKLLWAQKWKTTTAGKTLGPISLGPGTPWPNRAEAAIRMFKKQVSLMLISLKDDPLLANITYKQLLRQVCISRNTMVTHGGVTPIELAFGRRPADLTAAELMNPAQLKASNTLYLFFLNWMSAWSNLRPRGGWMKAKWQMNVELGEVNSETCREGSVDESDPHGRMQEGVAEKV